MPDTISIVTTMMRRIAAFPRCSRASGSCQGCTRTSLRWLVVMWQGNAALQSSHRLDTTQTLDSIWYDSEEYAATFVSSSLFLRLYCA